MLQPATPPGWCRQAGFPAPAVHQNPNSDAHDAGSHRARHGGQGVPGVSGRLCRRPFRGGVCGRCSRRRLHGRRWCSRRRTLRRRCQFCSVEPGHRTVAGAGAGANDDDRTVRGHREVTGAAVGGEGPATSVASGRMTDSFWVSRLVTYSVPSVAAATSCGPPSTKIRSATVPAPGLMTAMSLDLMLAT